MPTVTGRIIDREAGDYFANLQPDKIIQSLFKPYFEDRENMQSGFNSSQK